MQNSSCSNDNCSPGDSVLLKIPIVEWFEKSYKRVCGFLFNNKNKGSQEVSLLKTYDNGLFDRSEDITRHALLLEECKNYQNKSLNPIFVKSIIDKIY